MSKDKCGAANVAGFIKAVAMLAPRNVRVIAELGFVRNSVGSNAYVDDEIIRSHAGVRGESETEEKRHRDVEKDATDSDIGSYETQTQKSMTQTRAQTQIKAQTQTQSHKHTNTQERAENTGAHSLLFLQF